MNTGKNKREVLSQRGRMWWYGVRVVGSIQIAKSGELVIIQNINLTMSSRRQEANSRRRTSQRMRLKQLRNVDEYKIQNPFRKHNDTLPEELHKQLRRIDYLSNTSILSLSLPPSPPHPTKHDLHLQRMAQAHLLQENKFISLFGTSTLELTEIDHEHCSHSQAPPTHPSYGPEHHEDKDLLQLHMYDDRSHLHGNLFESRGLVMEEQSPLMQVEQPQQPPVLQEPPSPVLIDDFQQYFTS